MVAYEAAHHLRGRHVLARAQRFQGLLFGWVYQPRQARCFEVHGLLHASLMWTGDILRAYAITGMLLLGWVLLLRKPKLQRFNNHGSMLKFSLGLMSLPFVFMLGFGSYYALTHDTATMHEQWQERLQTEVVADELLAKAKAAGVDLTATKDDNKDEAEVDVDALAPAQRLQHLAQERAESKAERNKEEQTEVTAFTQPSFWQATAYRTGVSLEEFTQLPFMALFGLFPLFLFGYWLVASGKLRDAAQHPTLFKTMAWVGVGIGLAINAAAIGILAHPASRHVLIVGNAAGGLFQLGQIVLAAGYLGLFVVAMQSQRWRPRLLWLAPLGRMALTNYLMHSLILSTLFYGYGFAQFGQIARGPQMLIVIAIIAAQWVFSRLWLANFRYGPMEWVWRSITYWKIQPLRLSRDRSPSAFQEA